MTNIRTENKSEYNYGLILENQEKDEINSINVSKIE